MRAPWSKRDALASAGREVLEAEALGRSFERAVGDIDAHDLFEYRVREQRAQEPSLPTAEIEDGPRALSLQHGEHGTNPFVGEADPPLDVCLLIGMRGLGDIGIDALVLDQPRERLPCEALEVLEVAAGDEVLLGMFGQPALTLTQQLLELVLSDEVVLVVVENRNENVEVGQELRECPLRSQLHGEVGSLAPRRERGVERVVLGVNLVPERLEQAAQQPLAAAAGKNGEPGDQRAGAVRPGLAGPGIDQRAPFRRPARSRRS